MTIIGLGLSAYLFTEFVYRHVNLFAESLFALYESNSSIVRELANLMIALLFTPALRVITILVCLVLLFFVNKKK
ncbi:hypothetical protein DQ182_11970 [Enterococcus faecium]|nr:hypothetical protein [Enterococcus faecium]EGP5223668.1 hypothetical protein [Enterococcus faecium]EGP5499238.1 hypothetical protein [Enterococcus faecium]EGP5528533.1 hypothetical protein [Enterococcus faecium]EGP5544181.1 hypothetical protein [Enterococcus faecium]